MGNVVSRQKISKRTERLSSLPISTDFRCRDEWQLIREIGVEYSEPTSTSAALNLTCPVVVECDNEGRHLIVDEIEGEMCVPVRFQARTIVLSSTDRIQLDTRDYGIHDGYGRFVGDGAIGVLRRTRWDILILGLSGEIQKRIDLACVSKLTPRIMSWTGWSFLVLFLTKSHNLDIVEIDCGGNVLWYLPSTCKQIGVPGSMQLLPNNSILIADEYRHVVQEISRDGSAKIRWGEWAHSASDVRHLSGPKWAQQAPDETLVVADSNNHRILLIDPEQNVRAFCPVDQTLITPSSARLQVDGRLLISDYGSRSIAEFDAAGEVTWQAGVPTPRRRLFSFPRSVQYVGVDAYLIADTAANRLVEVNQRQAEGRSVRDGIPLFWPRAAYRRADGITLIADGRNSRIVEMNADGEVLRQLSSIRWNGELMLFSDPHDVRPLPNGNILVADAGQNVVLETSWDGDVCWHSERSANLTLADPHSAQLIDNQKILICDSGNHRILLVDKNDGSVQAVRDVRGESCVYRLNSPRYAECSPDGTLVIVDTGNNRVLTCDSTGRLVWELSVIPHSPIRTLSHPRWANLISKDEVLISDHFHHRILHLRRNIA